MLTLRAAHKMCGTYTQLSLGMYKIHPRASRSKTCNKSIQQKVNTNVYLISISVILAVFAI